MDNQMANGTPLTTNNGTNSNVYVYGAFVLKQGKLVDQEGKYIVDADTNGNNIYLKGIVPNGDN